MFGADDETRAAQDGELGVRVENSDPDSVGEEVEGDEETRSDKETPEESDEDEDEKVNRSQLSEFEASGD